MSKYNLTFWQRFSLPFIWILWFASDSENRKTWHELKKGIEYHEHTYGEVYIYKGYKFRDCIHEGCNMSTIMDDKGKFL